MSSRHYKLLFHEKTLAKAMAGFAFPSDMDARRAVVARWITLLDRGTLGVIKEVSLHGEFLRNIFAGHCTGAEAFGVMKEELGARLRALHTGNRFEV